MAGGAAHLKIPASWGKATVTGLLMEVLMMVMKVARGILCVAVIIVRSLVFFSMRKMTAVMLLPRLLPKGLHQSLCLEFLLSHLQVNVVVDVITMEGDAAPLITHAGKEKETVMVQQMEDEMMETKDALDLLYVEATTVHSLVHTTMKRTTVVRSRQPYLPQQPSLDSRSKVGVNGPSMGHALPPVGQGGR